MVNAREVERWIAEAAAALELGSEQLRRLDQAAAAEVVARVRERFVAGDPRVWWMSLRLPYTSHPAPRDPEDDPRALFPVQVERCWLMPDPDEHDELPVYELDPAQLMPLLGECPFFEYYLIDRELRWLLVETEHNQIQVVPAARPLEDDDGVPVWAPLVHVERAREHGESDDTIGFMYVALPARDEAELRARLGAAFERLGLVVRALEEVEPLADRAARGEASDALVALGRQAAWAGDLRFHTLHEEETDAEDEQVA